MGAIRPIRVDHTDFFQVDIKTHSFSINGHLLIRQGGYIVKLCAFYFYKVIRKLTSSLQFQQFSLLNITVPQQTLGVVLGTLVKDWEHCR